VRIFTHRDGILRGAIFNRSDDPIQRRQHKMVEFAKMPSKDKDGQTPDERHTLGTGTSTPNGPLKRRTGDAEGSRKRRKKKSRRLSVSKPARDPRDDPSPQRLAEEAPDTRSPSPVIDFDGLSRPSKYYYRLCLFTTANSLAGRGTRERLEETPEQATARLDKMSDAVRTILQCIGEDPSREGLLGTPERYAKAMLFFTRGYQENVRDIVNDAIFHEGHNELVIVKDIEIFSLCEHHMVPFTGKVGIDIARIAGLS
jgi:GTP cyclohydrolase IA